jgi:hypothetical protein
MISRAGKPEKRQDPAGDRVFLVDVASVSG